MRVDLTSLRLFATVAEELNIARAAEREHIAASAVSKRILDLEIAYQTPLLVRHSKGVELTSAGEALYQHARSMLLLADRVSVEMGGFASGARGHVRFSANTSSIIQFLPEALASFLATFPDIRISLHEATSARTIRMIEDGVVDLGIVGLIDDHPHLQYLPFRTDNLALVIPHHHPLSSLGRPVAFEETLDFDHVGLEEGGSIQTLINQVALSKKKPVNFKLNVASFDGVRRMVEAGIGISVLPTSCIQPYVSSMRISCVPLTDAWAARILRIMYREETLLPPPARLLVRHLLSGLT